MEARADTPPAKVASPGETVPAGQGLSARLLRLAVAFVLLAEVLIYLPWVTSYQRAWLSDRLAAAQIAAVVLEAAPSGGLPVGLQERLLDGVGASAVAVRASGARRLLASADTPSEVGRTIDLRQTPPPALLREALVTLFSPSGRPLRVIGQGMDGVEFVEIIMEEEPLREALVDFSRTVFLVSLGILAITAAVVYLVLQVMIVRPVRRLARNVAEFANGPDDASRIIAPTGRSDEIGLAERALASMEAALADELRRKRRLADLGLGVAKVNHELRNMLATAQLLADRLEAVPDPAVQRTLPRLVATLRRAIDFSAAILAYSRAGEAAPRRSRILLRPLAEALADLPGVALADEQAAPPASAPPSAFQARSPHSDQGPDPGAGPPSTPGTDPAPSARDPISLRKDPAPGVRDPISPGKDPAPDSPGPSLDVAALPGQASHPAELVALHLDIPPDLVVDADPEQLARALANLTRNAVQALASSLPERPRIGIQAWREGRATIIRIRDNGPGVPARTRPQLFEPFSASGRSGGTGLGLPICAEIVRLHGGTLTIEETQGGAAFLMMIPDRD